MIPRQHSVRFYEDDVFLTEAVASRIKLGLQVKDTRLLSYPLHIVLISTSCSYQMNWRILT